MYSNINNITPNQITGLDEIPLEGINPLNEPPPSAVASVLPGSSTSVSAVVGISGVSPPHSSTQDSVPIIIEDDSPPPKRSKGQQMQQEKPYDEKKGQQKSHSKSRSPGGGGGGSRAKYSSYESSQKSHSKSRSPRTSRNKYYDFVIQISLQNSDYTINFFFCTYAKFCMLITIALNSAEFPLHAKQFCICMQKM